MNKKWYKRRKYLFYVVEVGDDLDNVSRVYDYINVLSVILNLVVSIMYTYADIRAKYGDALVWIERIMVAFFAMDYVLRLITARFLYPDETESGALTKYIFSFGGIVDMFSFVPYYLPIFVPSGTVAFRMIRIVRIFRLFRINAFYDSLSVITDIIRGKSNSYFRRCSLF